MALTLEETVRALLAPGKGILAADESNNSADLRLQAVGVEATEENRRRYRELLFTTPGIEEYLSGVILYDETLRQNTTLGVPFREVLSSRGILVGIKVDQGLEDVPGGQVTKGLEGLGERLSEYRALGATFTKWRAVARVGDGYADPVIKENAKRLAEYARLAHEHGLVPMVEPEVLMEGVHSAEDAEGALIETIAIVYDALRTAGVDHRTVILKTSMAVSGKSAESRADATEVALRTIRALTTTVPEGAGGVVFLSGGQSPEEAARNFNAIARQEPYPWPITFSFSRAIQEPVLETWSGKDEMQDEAQAMLVKRLTLLVRADAGGYTDGMEAL